MAGGRGNMSFPKTGGVGVNDSLSQNLVEVVPRIVR
jgi:hypothetical protein